MPDNSSPRRSKLPIIIVLVVVLIVAGAATAVFAFNVFNLRDGAIIPALSTVPIVGDLVTPATEYDEHGQPIPRVPAVPAVNVGDLQERLDDLEAEYLLLREELRIAQSLNTSYEQEIASLRNYRDFIHLYNERQEELAQVIATGDPEGFAALFEAVYPHHAEPIYAHIRARQQVEREFRRYAAPYMNIDASHMADLSERMLATDTELLISILQAKNTNRRAEVFDEMSYDTLAIITRLMEPMMDEAALLFGVPLTAPPPINVNIPPPPPPIEIVPVAAAEEPEEPAEPEETEPEEE